MNQRAILMVLRTAAGHGFWILPVVGKKGKAAAGHGLWILPVVGKKGKSRESLQNIYYIYI
jgi:hypothetical protein